MATLARGVAVAVILSFPVVVEGHGFGLLRPRTTVAYYYPAPVAYVPVLAYPVCIPPPLPVYPPAPLPSAPGRTYAQPTPAPPSAGPSTAEPPLAEPLAPAKPSPAPPSPARGFGESTSFYDAYSLASPMLAKPAGERCRVDFWNLTDRDLVLRVDGGPAQVLPRGKNAPMTTGREFTWQVEGRETQTARIEDGEAALQIVIRR